uniref:F-box domain-containing protein n=2 Tax=Chenopodium quinoa TaxID=63459 RepID=A0A803N7S8_CHEQI
MASLPTDIISEILCRLPVKTLLRFLCVSKSWYSLIKTPKFIKLHLNQTLKSNTNRHLLLTHSTLSSGELRRQFHFSEIKGHPFIGRFNPRKDTCPLGVPPDSCPLQPAGLQFHGSCNGVVCISDPEKIDVVLYNPNTKTHRFLPKTENPYPDKFSIFGFGYDSGSDDYKVLRMMQCVGPNDEILNDARVYSLRKNSWRKIDHMPYHVIYDDGGVLLDGVLHYVASKVAFSRKTKSIAKFDIRTETYSVMDGPDYDRSLQSWTMYLGNVNGCLSLSVNYDFHGRADLWVMKEYGKKESWMKAVCIGNHQGSLIDLRAIGCSDDGEKILVEMDNYELCWFDMRRQKSIRAGIEGLPKYNYRAAIYVESLVMLDGDRVQSQGSKVVSKGGKKGAIGR